MERYLSIPLFVCVHSALIMHAEHKPRLEYVLDVGVRMPLVLRNARLVLSSWYSSGSTRIWAMFVHRPFRCTLKSRNLNVVVAMFEKRLA
jgi:hypothetical protein